MTGQGFFAGLDLLEKVLVGFEEGLGFGRDLFVGLVWLLF
jgi:hypothetical protein